MELQQLAYFRSAARLQHMTRAAEAEGVAQPSLSKSIRLLENELGVDLFERNGRGVRLTKYGRAFIRHVDAVFRSIDDGRKELVDMSSSRQEELVISCVTFFWATNLFTAFSQRRPTVRYRLLQRAPAEMLRQLLRREIDLCLASDPKDRAFEWTRLVTGDVWVMVPPGHRLEGGGTVSFADLTAEPMILPRPGAPLREVVDALYAEAGVEPNVICESDDIPNMHSFVLAGLGLRFLTDFEQVLARHPDPLYLRLTDPERSVEVGMAWCRDGYRTEVAQDFAAFALEHVRKEGLKKTEPVKVSTEPTPKW